MGEHLKAPRHTCVSKPALTSLVRFLWKERNRIFEDLEQMPLRFKIGFINFCFRLFLISFFLADSCLYCILPLYSNSAFYRNLWCHLKLLSFVGLRLLWKCGLVVMNWCYMFKSGESIDHLLLHYEAIRMLWAEIFNRTELAWVRPKRVVDLFTCWKGIWGNSELLMYRKWFLYHVSCSLFELKGMVKKLKMGNILQVRIEVSFSILYFFVLVFLMELASMTFLYHFLAPNL